MRAKCQPERSDFVALTIRSTPRQGPAGYEDPAARLHRGTPPAAQPLGSAGGDPGAGFHHRLRRRQPLSGPSVELHHRPYHGAQPAGPSGLRTAYRPADADRAGRVAGLHFYLRHLGRKKAPRRQLAGAPAGYSAVGADPGLSIGDSGVVPVAVAGAHLRRRDWPASSPSSPARPGTWLSASIRACAPCRRSWKRPGACSASMPGPASGASRRPSPPRR